MHVHIQLHMYTQSYRYFKCFPTFSKIEVKGMRKVSVPLTKHSSI